MNKQCRGCNAIKELRHFNRKKDNADGYKNYCISCCAIRLNNWRNTNKGKRKNHDKKYKNQYPEKIVARNALNKAIIAGTLKRSPCEECGLVKSQAHHPDYCKPFDVKWLCAKHHRAVHL